MASNCVHVNNIEVSALEAVFDASFGQRSAADAGRDAKCWDCGKQTVNLWRCLEKNCCFVGCGEKYKDHSQSHATANSHPVMINMGTKRAWCIFCQSEVHLFNNQPPVPGVSKILSTGSVSSIRAKSSSQSQKRKAAANNLTSLGSHQSLSTFASMHSLHGDNVPFYNPAGLGDEESVGSADDNSSETSSSKSYTVCNPVGLTGLKNLGNTCYLNSAVQALSACVPLTNYFLTAYAHTSEEKPPLAKYYQQMLRDIWSDKKPSFIIPTTFLQGFKAVNPAFRGYNQQDSQEFLRCFMDRLHEELKKPVVYPVCVSCRETINAALYDDGHSIPQFCERCSLSLTSMQRDDLIYESQNSEEHMDLSIPPSSNPGQSPTSLLTLDSGFSERSFSSSANLPVRRSPDPHSSSGTDSARRGLDRRRTISASSALSSMTNSRQGRKRKSSAAVKYSSIISDVFNGKILSSVQCLHCHQTSEISETFQDLSLPIPNKEDLYLIHHQPQLTNIVSTQSSGMSATSASMWGDNVAVRNTNPCNNVYNSQGWISWIYDWFKSMFWGPVITLNDCLAAFFSADELKAENMYSCDKCQKLRNGLKVSKVQELPEVLCIHLKRFRHEYLLSSKVSTYVSFPMEGLSLAPFLSDANQSAVYDLVATICHYGYASGGHYTAYALNDLNKCWYEFDDQIVSQVPASQIQKAEVYVLFYRKRASPEILSYRKEVRLRSRSARNEEKVRNVNETSSPTSANGSDSISSASLYDTGSIPGSVASSTRSQKKRSSKSFSAGGVGAEADEGLQFNDRLMQYYISKQWLNKFSTFVNPGPITNSDFLCKHNRIPPLYVSVVDSLAEEVPGIVWEFLYDKFRGGPVVNHLHVCATCKQEKEALELKRTQEREAFQKLNSEFRSQKCPAESFLIDLRWYKEWEAFVRGRADPPGPIDNQAIQPRSGRFSTSDHDVGQISAETWKFLVSIYGGGPELIHRNEAALSVSHSPQNCPSPSPTASSTP